MDSERRLEAWNGGGDGVSENDARRESSGSVLGFKGAKIVLGGSRRGDSFPLKLQKRYQKTLFSLDNEQK